MRLSVSLCQSCDCLATSSECVPPLPHRLQLPVTLRRISGKKMNEYQSVHIVTQHVAFSVCLCTIYEPVATFVWLTQDQKHVKESIVPSQLHIHSPDWLSEEIRFKISPLIKEANLSSCVRSAARLCRFTAPTLPLLFLLLQFIRRALDKLLMNKCHQCFWYFWMNVWSHSSTVRGFQPLFGYYINSVPNILAYKSISREGVSSA